MLKSEIQKIISHYESIKLKAYEINTECGDKKVVECERVIIQCEQVLRSMKSVNTEIAILEGMV